MFHAGVLDEAGRVRRPAGGHHAPARRRAKLMDVAGSFCWRWSMWSTAPSLPCVQTDLKYMIGFSSVSHMGLVMLGFATLNREGLMGAGVQMFSHGVMTALFFAVVGMIYDRAHTRQIPELGGMRKVMPLVAIWLYHRRSGFDGYARLLRFCGRIPDLHGGVGKTYAWIAIIAGISIVITAAYIMRIIGKVFFGDLPEEFDGHVHDVTVLDKVALVFLSAILIVVGVYPSIMVPMVESGVQNILRLLGGA